MLKRTLALAALYSALQAVIAPANAATITFSPYLGPTSAEEGFTRPSASFPAAAAIAVSAIYDGVDSRGGSLSTSPTAFNRLAGHNLSTNDILAGEHSYWRGDANPVGAFAAETGTWWRLGVRVQSDTAFKLTDIKKEFSDGYGDSDVFNMAGELTKGRYAENGFAPTLAVGLWYGPDGVAGTGDDVFCDSAACDVFTQPLNVFAWRGAGKGDWLDQAYVDANLGGDWGLLAKDERDFYASGGFGAFVTTPFFWNYRYTLSGASGVLAQASYHATVGAPEPATWAMFLLGFAGVGAIVRRRRANLCQRRRLA